MNAEWTSSRIENQPLGTGVVRGRSVRGFAGQYVVTYYLADGGEAGTFDVCIEESGSAYRLSWSRDGTEVLSGMGIETPDGLAIGYCSR
jgi:hypothetical protein